MPFDWVGARRAFHTAVLGALTLVLLRYAYEGMLFRTAAFYCWLFSLGAWCWLSPQDDISYSYHAADISPEEEP